MATAVHSDLRKARNFRANLKRVFASWASIPAISKDAGVHHQQIRKLLRGETENTGLETAEKIAIALEVSLETLLADNPSDAELRISSKMTA